MKINHRAASNALLPPDFAPRVVQRVSRIKRRRTLRRRALAAVGVLTVGLGAFVAQRHASLATLQPQVALQSPNGGNPGAVSAVNEEPVSYQEQSQPPVNLFLPDTYLMTNFEDSTGEPSWHSYDSWWGSNS